MIKYVFFDLAGTLIYKPDIYITIQLVLERNKIVRPLWEIQTQHTKLSNLTQFPSRTTKKFYNQFNGDLLRSLEIKSSSKILTAIYQNCHNIPWKIFHDTSILNTIPLPIGIISNWDSTLQTKVESLFSVNFWKIYGSSNIGLTKPDLNLYRYVVNDIKCNPAEIAYIGDSVKLDIEPAGAIGMKAILLDRHDAFPHYSGLKASTLDELLSLW